MIIFATKGEKVKKVAEMRSFSDPKNELVNIARCTSQQILDTNFKKLFSCIVRLYKQYGTLDITLRNVGQLSPTVLDS